MSNKELEVLESYISKHNLKITNQRRAVLKAFLGSEKHVSVEELYNSISKSEAKIGLATVYRTLTLLTKSGLASEMDFGDGQKRYEHCYMHEHHDHMICIKCKKVYEFCDDLIEERQLEIVKKSVKNISVQTVDHIAC